MTNRTCIIVLSGTQPREYAAKKLIELAAFAPRPLIIAADGGAEALDELEIIPDLVIGDMDSLTADTQKKLRKAGTQFSQLPTRKNFIDGEAVLEEAIAVNPQEIKIFGADGGRLDFILANHLLPLRYNYPLDRIVFYGHDYRAGYCTAATTIHGEAGDTVSLIALTSCVNGITLNGFEYPLEDYHLGMGSSRCLSNVLADNTGQVSHKGGILFYQHYFRR